VSGISRNCFVEKLVFAKILKSFKLKGCMIKNRREDMRAKKTEKEKKKAKKMSFQASTWGRELKR
jgi:hypothetical protein